MADLLPAPYPADTRAKGWRFELDYEQIEQSSTWALAGSEARPWLLMLWMTSWRQVPCGSLPADHDVIAAMIGMQPKAWAKLGKVMLRGWELAEDGRLYHGTITARVLEMLDYRKKNADRVAKFKAALREQRGGNALPEGEQPAKNDTGTGTLLIPSVAKATGGEPPAAKGKDEAKPDPRRELYQAGKSLLHEQGMPKAQTGSFITKLAQDYGQDVALEAVRSAVSNRPLEAAAYLKATCQHLKGERAEPVTVPSDAAERTKAALEADRAREIVPIPDAVRKQIRGALKVVT